MNAKHSKPRLPGEARTKLRKGATHKDKKQYDRKRDKCLKALDRMISSAFFVSFSYWQLHVSQKHPGWYNRTYVI